MANESKKLFKYDSPHTGLSRLFLLDLNGEDEPLSGRVLSFTFREIYTDIGSIVKPLYHIFSDKTSNVMEALTGSDKYIALSYPWGDGKEQHPLRLSTISCNLDPTRKNDSDRERIIMDHEPDRNGYLMINTNLHDYLLEHRRRRLNQFIWADAICINQASPEDKNNQIPLMRHYYEAAEVVNVWLGQATLTEKGALRIMPAITQNLNTAKVTQDETKHSIPELLELIDLPPADNGVWYALATILSRPWWDRLWVRSLVNASFLDLC